MIKDQLSFNQSSAAQESNQLDIIANEIRQTVKLQTPLHEAKK
jgi:hypothetical protein